MISNKIRALCDAIESITYKPAQRIPPIHFKLALSAPYMFNLRILNWNDGRIRFLSSPHTHTKLPAFCNLFSAAILYVMVQLKMLDNRNFRQFAIFLTTFQHFVITFQAPEIYSRYCRHPSMPLTVPVYVSLYLQFTISN